MNPKKAAAIVGAGITKNTFIYLFALLPILVYGQSSDTLIEKNAQEVIVRAYEQNRKLKDLPAAINYVSPSALQRFSPASLVPAINSTPGIRMEERSPGSYRFN